MQADSNLLLSAETLFLAPGLVRGEAVRGVFALKRVDTQTYLVVDALQAAVLEEFTKPSNVPDALERCIRRRACPPLREFYDLILKAHRAGVLRCEELGVDHPAPPCRPAVRWFVALPPRITLAVIALFAAATLAAGALRLPSIPGHLYEVVLGWVAVCASFSLGQVLAASVLRGAGREVHQPRFRWLTLTPHFALDLRDTCLVGRAARAAVLGATLVPLAGLTAAGLWLGAPWSFVPLVALFFSLWPTGSGLVPELLLLLRRKPLLDTDTAPLFDADLALAEQARVTWHRFDLRVAAVQFAAGLLWLAAASRTALAVAHLDPRTAVLRRLDWRIGLIGLGVALVALCLYWGLAHVQHRVIDRAVLAGGRWRALWRRWRAGRVTTVDPEAAEALIRRHPLLRRLDPEAQWELVSHLQPVVYGPWRRLLSFDEDPPFVGLILSGRATLYRRLPSGRKERFLSLIEGNLFGAHALVGPGAIRLEARAATPLVVLALRADDFKRLVIDPLGAAAVGRYVHQQLFLERSCALCATWRPAAVARFAELTATASHGPGGKIIEQGKEVFNLYVLYEGRARALRNRKPVGRLAPGDCFGEISLLQTSTATADVETQDDVRCLVVNRVEFIRFMSRNHHVALELERLCSKRLGRPIFPLQTDSFDER